MTLLITGITGHSGRLFAERLSKGRYKGPIRCISRPGSDTGFLKMTGLNYSVVTGDLDDADFLDTAMKEVETVFHIAHINYSSRIVHAAISNNVQWAILVHTTGRYSKFKSASSGYIEIEKNISSLRGKIFITLLRPTMIYGSSRDRNMYKLIDYLFRRKFFPVFGDGNNLMQPVLAKDLADAYFGVLMNRAITANQEYNLPGKNPIKYIDLLKSVCDKLGTNNVLVRIPIGLALFGARVYGAVSKDPLISVEQVMRMREDKVFSYEAARRDFGYDPADFNEGIKSEIDEFVRNENTRF
jgi:nucleoside-diphosphate-sugar epimerase